MKHKISIIYSWLIRSLMYFLPNYPIIMRFRGWLYSLMMKDCGKNFQVCSNVIINSLSQLIIGKNVYLASNTVIVSINVEIGDDVIIGPNNVISGGNHKFDGKSFRFLPSSKGKVIINDGCWVGANCTITSDSILPARSILAAGAVLTKQYSEELSIYAGVPAKKIGQVK